MASLNLSKVFEQIKRLDIEEEKVIVIMALSQLIQTRTACLKKWDKSAGVIVTSAHGLQYDINAAASGSKIYLSILTAPQVSTITVAVPEVFVRLKVEACGFHPLNLSASSTYCGIRLWRHLTSTHSGHDYRPGRHIHHVIPASFDMGDGSASLDTLQPRAQRDSSWWLKFVASLAAALGSGLALYKTLTLCEFGLSIAVGGAVAGGLLAGVMVFVIPWKQVFGWIGDRIEDFNQFCKSLWSELKAAGLSNEILSQAWALFKKWCSGRMG